MTDSTRSLIVGADAPSASMGLSIDDEPSEELRWTSDERAARSASTAPGGGS